MSLCWACFGTLHVLVWPFLGVFLFFLGCPELDDKVSVFSLVGYSILLEWFVAVALHLVVYHVIVYLCFLFAF